MPLFNFSQSFFIDSTSVKSAPFIQISSVGLFFMYRPDPLLNRTTIQNPGVNLYFTDVQNDLPNIANTALFQHVARCEWNQIQTSSDASAETRFTFPVPITIATDRSYAVLISFDGGEDFVVWTDIVGNKLVGTNTPASAPNPHVIGKYFKFTSFIEDITQIASVNDYDGLWKPLDNVYLKFNIYAARYAVNGDPIISNTTLSANTVVFQSNLLYSFDTGNNVVSIYQPSPRIENIAFDPKTSLKQTYVGAQRVYQNTVFWPGTNSYATVSVNMSNTVTANAQTSNGVTFSWNNVFANTYTGDKYLVIHDINVVDIRKVVSVISNTVILVDEPTTFVNTNAKFTISPVAKIDGFNVSYLNGLPATLMFLRDSSANSTVRFTSDSIDHTSVLIANGGNSYSNSDVLYFVGFEANGGNFAAAANVRTNGSGTIQSLAFSNIGAGFANSANVRIVVSNTSITANNSSTNTSLGSNLALTVNVGSTLYTEFQNNIFTQCKVVNIDLSDIIALFNRESIAISSNNFLQTSALFQYYAVQNTTRSAGYDYFVQTPIQEFPLQYGIRTSLITQNNIPCVVSRSNEYAITYSNGHVNDIVNALVPYSNSVMLKVQTKVDDDWHALGPFSGAVVEFGRYIVNNDYTNENTNYGNALARHIMTQINLTGINGRLPEDIRVYLTAWRPPNTDFQVFARIQNSSDVEAFDDEDWTRLELIDGDIFRSDTYVEMTYGFQNCPNVQSILPGYAQTVNNSTTITGSNTFFSANLSQYDLIKLYDPLFSNDNFAVLQVNNIVSNTSLNVDQVLSTNSQAGIGGNELTGRGGLQIAKLTSRNQAFNNIQNENVVRYYNANNHVYDYYNILQIKICLLSSDPHRIPRVHNVRGSALSALYDEMINTSSYETYKEKYLCPKGISLDSSISGTTVSGKCII